MERNVPRKTPPPASEPIVVSEPEQIRVVEPLECPVCGSLPTARPATPVIATGPTCPSCGTAVDAPVPPLPRRPKGGDPATAERRFLDEVLYPRWRFWPSIAAVVLVVLIGGGGLLIGRT